MILAIDMGNTAAVLGCIDDQKIYFTEELSTDLSKSPLEYAMGIKTVLELYNIDSDNISGAIISCVVPSLQQVISRAVQKIINKAPLIVGPGLKTGLNIKTNNPAELGADMVAGAVASIEKYPCPQIIFDLGTATTASVIDKNGCFIGCSILCGVKTALNALASGTAQLPQIDIVAPKNAICTNTIDCMRSGTVYGTAAMIDGLVKRFEKELGQEATVIITGGLGGVIAKYCETKAIVDKNLVIDGLRLIYDKNTQERK